MELADQEAFPRPIQRFWLAGLEVQGFTVMAVEAGATLSMSGPRITAPAVADQGEGTPTLWRTLAAEAVETGTRAARESAL